MKLSHIFAVVGLVSVSGCTGSWVMPSAAAFDACRAECLALEDLYIPMCLIRKAPRDELLALFRGVSDALDESMEFQEGACGCLTATIDENGQFRDVEPVYSWLVDDPGLVVSEIERFQADQPFSERASCVVDVIAPITYYE
jgi:hypothetical protein